MGNMGIATLPDLVTKLKELQTLEEKAEQDGEVISYEEHRETEIIRALIAGRVDEAAELRAALDFRVDALKEAIAKASDLQDRIDLAFVAAIKMSGGNKLEGLVFNARVQNSKPSVVIEDESKVPDNFKYVDVLIKKRIPYSDLDARRFWTSVVLQRVINLEQFNSLSEVDLAIVGENLITGISKAPIYDLLKDNADSIPGAKLERNEHLRISPNKKPTKELPKGL